MRLESALRPRSLAIVGVNEKPGAFGFEAAKNALSSAIGAHTYLVHPTRSQLLGRTCYPSLEQLPVVPDCVQICTPAQSVADILRQAGRLGIRGAIICASGFAEDRSPAGRAREQELVEICLEYDIAMIGPNCIGVADKADSVYAWGMVNPFNSRQLARGAAVISQSGAIGLGLTRDPLTNAVVTVSTGNGNVVTLEDVLEYVVDDPRIDSVYVYAEGIKDGQTLCRALGKAALRRIPVVILKAGRSEKGAQSAASHTGNLAGDDAAFDAICMKYGVIRPDTVDQNLCICRMLSILGGRQISAPGCAGISFSGGASVMVADMCRQCGVDLPDIPPQTAEFIETRLPPFASAKNPLDATTAMFHQAKEFYSIICALGDDPAVGSIVLTMEAARGGFGDACTLDVLTKYAAEDGHKPVFVLPLYEGGADAALAAALAACGIPVLGCGQSGLSALSKVLAWHEYNSAHHDLAHPAPAKGGRPPSGFRLCTEARARDFLESQGFPFPRQALVSRKDMLAAVLLSYPLAIKINSPDIGHKTEAGGVCLNIGTLSAAEEAFDRIMQASRAYAPDARLEGVLVQEMARKGAELILGIKNDPQLGPMLLCGLGGTMTEVISDTALRACPVNRLEAEEMLKSLKCYPLLTGFRGDEACDTDALIALMIRLSQLAAAQWTAIAELEINPVFVRPDGVTCVDALLMEYDREERCE